MQGMCKLKQIKANDPFLSDRVKLRPRDIRGDKKTM